jgi:hypothetical protein
MAITLDNFVRSILATAATSGDTSLQLAAAAAPLRDPPVATEDAPGILVLQDVPSAPAKIEIISYTGRSIDSGVVTLTGVTRALEGTTAQSWDAGTPTFQGWTAGILSAMQGDIATMQAAITSANDSISALSTALDGKLDATATAAKATILATARNFSLTGIVTASAVSFDGSGNVALSTAIADGALSMAKVSGLSSALGLLAPADSPTFTGITTAGQGIFVTEYTPSGADCIVFNANRFGLTNAYAMGAEANCLFARAPSVHRWYISALADGGTSASMELTGSTLKVPSLTPGSGKILSKITVTSTAPGTLQNGELYLQY